MIIYQNMVIFIIYKTNKTKYFKVIKKIYLNLYEKNWIINRLFR